MLFTRPQRVPLEQDIYNILQYMSYEIEEVGLVVDLGVALRVIFHSGA